MKFGFYEMDITPPMGSIIPGNFGARYCDEILDKLYVRTVVVQNDEKLLAIAVIDACGITIDITESIRQRAVSLMPIKPEDIMVMATHTHGGGPTLNWGEEIVTDSNYLRTLTERCADAMYMAWKNAKEGDMLLGKEEITDISFIRVYEMKDGSLKTNPGRPNRDNVLKPTTTIDPELIVMAVKHGDSFSGAIVNFATHPATVFSNQITGDYISILANEMKRIYGPEFVTVFINGACGNINHVNLFDEPKSSLEIYKEVGKAIAQKSQDAISKSEVITDNTLLSASTNAQVRLRKPTAEQLTKAKELFDSYGDSLIESTPRGTDPNYVDMFFALQTFIIMADKRTVRDAFMQVFRIGSCYIAGTPTQLFVQYGKKIKKEIGNTCMVSAFANDYLGYVPTPDCMREGVYEARLAPTSGLSAETGDIIADTAIFLANRLK